MNLSFRDASDADVPLLADWNQRLIREEGHRNSMTLEQLQDRMKKWLQTGEYQAAIFSDTKPVAYSLYKKEETLIYIRQFYVRSDHRRKGVGSAAVALLRSQIWPAGVRLTVEVLCNNTAGVAFWRSVGYKDYCLALEIMP